MQARWLLKRDMKRVIVVEQGSCIIPRCNSIKGGFCKGARELWKVEVGGPGGVSSYCSVKGHMPDSTYCTSPLEAKEVLFPLLLEGLLSSAESVNGHRCPDHIELSSGKCMISRFMALGDSKAKGHTCIIYLQY